MTSPSLRERLAQAMALLAGHEWATMPDAVSPGEAWQYGRDWWRGLARTALHELECDLSDRKLRIVPEEATPPMIRAGGETYGGGRLWAVEVWPDFLSAAPSNASQLEKAP